MTYRNQFFVFGGTNYNGGDRRQISKISNCGLERIGTLDFDHVNGACAGVNDTRIYLCFNLIVSSDDYKRCRYAEDPLGTFTEAAFSFYTHRLTSIAASECKLQAYLQNSIFYSARILAVGGHLSKKRNFYRSNKILGVNWMITRLFGSRNLSIDKMH